MAVPSKPAPGRRLVSRAPCVSHLPNQPNTTHSASASVTLSVAHLTAAKRYHVRVVTCGGCDHTNTIQLLLLTLQILVPHSDLILLSSIFQKPRAPARTQDRAAQEAVMLVVLVVLAAGEGCVSGCHSRSGEDAERVGGHVSRHVSHVSRVTCAGLQSPGHRADL